MNGDERFYEDEMWADPSDVGIKQSDPYRGEKKLLYAVIEQAVRDFRGEPGGEETGETPIERNLRIFWAREFLTCTETLPGSINWILDLTGLPLTRSQILEAAMGRFRLKRGRRIRTG